MTLKLTMLVHGDAGTGKSWIGASAPGPRLVLDGEGRGLYYPTSKVWWDPRQPLPTTLADGSPITTDTSVIVDVREFGDFHRAYQWLASGQHYFESVVLDSLTELQQRCIDHIAGTHQMQTQDWGSLLRDMDKLVRDMRDLRTHPVKPIQALVVIALSHERNGKQRPMLQGSLSNKVAGHFDVVGYLSLAYDVASNQEQRQLLIRPIGLFEAKDNTDLLTRAYGHIITNPNVTEMLGVMNGAAAGAVPAAPTQTTNSGETHQ